MTNPVCLYYAPDNASLCVRLALELSRLPYETRLVDRTRKEQKSPAYRALNPMGLIPTLQTPHGPISETGAILLWLSEQAEGLLPSKGTPERGAALRWLFWLSNTLHPALRMLFYPEQYAPKGQEEAFRVMTRVRLGTLYQLLNNAADADWLTADAPPSIHSCYLAPMLRWPALYGGETGWFGLDTWPRLVTFAQTFETHPFAITAAAAEGLGPKPFSAPTAPNPPEGSAL